MAVDAQGRIVCRVGSNFQVIDGAGNVVQQGTGVPMAVLPSGNLVTLDASAMKKINDVYSDQFLNIWSGGQQVHSEPVGDILVKQIAVMDYQTYFGDQDPFQKGDPDPPLVVFGDVDMNSFDRPGKERWERVYPPQKGRALVVSPTAATIITAPEVFRRPPNAGAGFGNAANYRVEQFFNVGGWISNSSSSGAVGPDGTVFGVMGQKEGYYVSAGFSFELEAVEGQYPGPAPADFSRYWGLTALSQSTPDVRDMMQHESIRDRVFLGDQSTLVLAGVSYGYLQPEPARTLSVLRNGVKKGTVNDNLHSLTYVNTPPYYGGKVRGPGVVDINGRYVLGGMGLLTCIDRDGLIQWSVKPKDVNPEDLVSVPAVAADGTLYVLGRFSLFAFDPDGVLKWSVETRKQVVGYPVIGDDGIVYFGAGDEIHAVKGTAPTAPTSWPMAGGNPRHTYRATQPPTFTNSIPDVTLVSGQELRLAAGIKGTEPISLQWHLRGEPIPGATGSTLRKVVRAEDSGRYTIRAINGETGLGNSLEVEVLVLPATPEITWAPIRSRSYGNMLGASELSAVSPVAGRFVYNPPAGVLLPAGTNEIVARFLPEDIANWTETTVTNSWVVEMASPNVTWDPIPPIQYPNPLGPDAFRVSSGGLPGVFDFPRVKGRLSSSAPMKCCAISILKITETIVLSP